MMGTVFWEYLPPHGDVVALGWARGECMYEIAVIHSATREGSSKLYALWTVEPGTDKLVSLGKAPSTLQLTRIAERIEDQHLIADIVDEDVIDRTDDAEWTN